MPDWTTTLAVVQLALGLPLELALSCVFDLILHRGLADEGSEAVQPSD